MIPYDNHVHTHFAYCSDDDMLPEATTAIAVVKGCGISIVEHAAHLYTTNELYQSGDFIEMPQVVLDEENSRMNGYIKYVKRFAADNVKLGLEVEVFSDGSLTLKDEHSGLWDVLLGAVHFVPRRFADSLTKGFIWSLEAFANCGVDIIAHPFRLFLRAGMNPPKNEYKTVVDILRKNCIAAELNFHYNSPDEAFFKMCVENGVKISLGSDAHSLLEVCDLDEHFSMLRSVCGGEDLQKVIYYP